MAEEAPPARPDALPEALEAQLGAPFDPVLADATRVRIQAALHGLPPAGSMRFAALARTLGLSDGNLASHLAVLSEVGYAASESTFTGRRRTRWYRATPRGREAFEAYVRALQLVVDIAEQGREAER